MIPIDAYVNVTKKKQNILICLCVEIVLQQYSGRRFKLQCQKVVNTIMSLDYGALSFGLSLSSNCIMFCVLEERVL